MSKTFKQLRTEISEGDIYDNPVNNKVAQSSQNVPLRSSNRSTPNRGSVSTPKSNVASPVKQAAKPETNSQSRYSRLYQGQNTSGKTFYDLTNKKTPENVKSKQAGVSQNNIKPSKDIYDNPVNNKVAKNTQNVQLRSLPNRGFDSKPKTSVSSAPLKQSAKPASSSSVKAPVSSKSNDVLSQQKALIAKGAKIKADGIMGPKTAAAQKQFGSKTPTSASVKQGAKPSAPVNKTTTPQIKKTLPAAKPSAAMNDLRKSVDKLRGTSSAAVTATSRAKSALSKIPGTGRMDKPISKGGQSSSSIHSNISKLGGEPVKPVPKPSASKAMGTATVNRSSSKEVSGGKWM